MTESPVIRFSQHFHLLADEPIDESALTREEMDAWSDRVCGLATLRTVLAYHRLPVPSQTELLRSAVRGDLFTERGILHAGLGDLGTPYGLRGRAMADVDLGQVLALADRGFPSIVSVTHQLPTDGRQGGHLVVVVGSVAPDGVRFVDPSRWGVDNAEVSRERFAVSYTRRAIVFWPSQRASRRVPAC